MRFLSHRIADRRILQLIRRCLKAGGIENGRRIPSVKGTPQGAVASPLLANVYLHYALDLWIQAWRRQPDCGEVIAVRYADDSTLGFQKKGTAERFLNEMRERLAKFGLTLHPDKTQLIEFGRCRRKLARTGTGQTGDLRLLGLHALLRQRPARALSIDPLTGQEAHARHSGKTPRNPASTPE